MGLAFLLAPTLGQPVLLAAADQALPAPMADPITGGQARPPPMVCMRTGCDLVLLTMTGKTTAVSGTLRLSQHLPETGGLRMHARQHPQGSS